MEYGCNRFLGSNSSVWAYLYSCNWLKHVNDHLFSSSCHCFLVSNDLPVACGLTSSQCTVLLHRVDTSLLHFFFFFFLYYWLSLKQSLEVQEIYFALLASASWIGFLICVEKREILLSTFYLLLWDQGSCEALSRSCGCCRGIVEDDLQREQCESACDFATHIFCHKCSLCQEGRELRRRLPHPGFNGRSVLVMIPPAEQMMGRGA